MNDDRLNNNKRIAKNTILLYIRMIFTMIVSLYASRVVLNVLGIEDYGIYNVVGGVVAMLSFLTISLSGATSRFITYSLGKGEIKKLNSLFGIIKLMHIALAVIVLILAETLGFWFFTDKLVIPEERVFAAYWVFQCSIITALISIISVPYNSLIIAHEKMSVFAYISIIDCILKLFIVFLLVKIPYDKMIVYAILFVIVQFISFIMYRIYCRNYFVESKAKLTYVPQIIKEIGSYSIWTINGNLAIVGYTQGINMLLNIFFGPIVNSARAIAVQVQNAVMTFNQSFLTAINPQITKSYAIKDYSHMHKLIVSASKYGTYLMMIIVFPILMNIRTILSMWLGIIPEYTISFVKIMLITSLLQPMARTLVTSVHATGNIKKFQLLEGSSLLMVVPIVYVSLKFMNVSPVIVMWIYLGIEIITQLVRIFIVLPIIHMPYNHYFKKSIFPMILPTIGFILPLILIDFPLMEFTSLCMYIMASICYILIVIIIGGTTILEKQIIIQMISKLLNRAIYLIRK